MLGGDAHQASQRVRAAEVRPEGRRRGRGNRAQPVQGEGWQPEDSREGARGSDPCRVGRLPPGGAEHYRVPLMLAGWCARRSGEVRGLRRRDLDLERGVVHVEQQTVKGGARNVITRPKTAAGLRVVAIPPTLLPGLRAWLGAHPASGADDLLFTSADGGTLAHVGVEPPRCPRSPPRRDRQTGPYGPRVASHRAHPGRPGGRDDRRTHGPGWAHDPHHGSPLSARRWRARPRDCCEAWGNGSTCATNVMPIVLLNGAANVTHLHSCCLKHTLGLIFH